MVAVPAFTAVTFPLASTVAMVVLLLFHVTALLVALAGATVTFNVSAAPSTKLNVDLFSFTPVTFTAFFVTVTVHFAVLPPSFVVTVMVAVPAFTAVTFPLASTVAIAVLLLFQLSFLLKASLGKTVAKSVVVSPSVKVNAVLSNLTLLTISGVLSSSLQLQKVAIQIRAINIPILNTFFIIKCF